MLKDYFRLLICATAISLGIFGSLILSPIDAAAESCAAESHVSNIYDITVGGTCGGSSGTSSSTGSQSGGDTSEHTNCFDLSGAEIPCWYDDMAWSAQQGAYCKQIPPPADVALTREGDKGTKQVGYYYRCGVPPNGTIEFFVWQDEPIYTPPDIDMDAWVRRTVATLHLHPPQVGLSAYVYPGYDQWGLSWWIGAPMWLWVDQSDDLQWGTHTVSATQDDLTVTATVTAVRATYDPGDGSQPVVCGTAGSPRPWNKHDLLKNHSPSGCEYTYLQTNTMGDRDSRFLVTSTVTWTVVWTATNGQAGTYTMDLPSPEPASIHVGEIYVVNGPPPR
jgi:hypothetical protein